MQLAHQTCYIASQRTVMSSVNGSKLVDREEDKFSALQVFQMTWNLSGDRLAYFGLFQGMQCNPISLDFFFIGAVLTLSMASSMKHAWRAAFTA